jgi:transcriptional regulator with XRE-family HTH domain
MTLADLSARTGISVSTLSRLKSGTRRPTLEQLLPLARAHGRTLDELVDAPPTGDPRIHLRPITCDGGTTVLPLTRRPGGIQAYKFVLAASPHPEEPEPRTHEGYEWLYVLNGKLRLVLGEHDLVLAPARPPSSTRTRPTGSAPQPPNRSSSSASSGDRANVRTSAPLPGRERLCGSVMRGQCGQCAFPARVTGGGRHEHHLVEPGCGVGVQPGADGVDVPDEADAARRILR